MPRNDIPVTILSGYLGAGKTTLINHVLGSMHGRRIAVLVNDFGAINIDASLIADRGADTITLSNGCVCCTIEDDLAAALGAQRQRQDPPEHILIEASGVAEPARMLRYATGYPGLALGGIVTVADAARVEMQVEDKFVGRLVARQLKAAHMILANKMDLIDAARLQRLRAWIDAIAPTAVLVQARNGEMDPELLLAPLASEIRRSGETASEADPMPFHSVSVAFPNAIDARALEQLLSRLPSSVQRVKGFVRDNVTGVRMLVQVTGGGRPAITRYGTDSSAPSALVAIGTSADDIQILGQMLRQCADGRLGAIPTFNEAT